MSRTVLYYIAAGAFFIAAIASLLGSQWIFAGVAVALAAAFLIFAIREGKRPPQAKP